MDEAAQFLDGGKLPCILVENKVDLLDGDSENDQGLTQFSEDNNFCGSFRA